MQSKKGKETCEKGGRYGCLYHPKNKIKIKKDSTFPACNFAGLTCEGTWHLIKEIKEKTRDEIFAANNHKRMKLLINKRRNSDYYKSLKSDKKPWNFENW